MSDRISERIRTHEATIGALDVRIKRREGDLPFDVRVEDGMKTLGELESEREHHRGRVLRLTLLRDGLVADEIYALGSADLRLADLIPPDCPDASTIPDERCLDDGRIVPIDGLKLTISGHELRSLLEQRMRDHERRAERWRDEQARTPEQETDEPLLPDHICENEAERSDWQVGVLGFIRDHVEAASVYRLGGQDLAFGDLLPEKPGWLEQRNTNSARALDSSWNDSPRDSANYGRWTSPLPHGRRAAMTAR